MRPNLNIEIPTLSDLLSEGEPGNFKACIKKSPRFINEQICNDCGECTTACPVETDDKFNRNLGKRKAIQKYYAQAIPNLPNMLKLGHAPCKIKCPANVNIQGYVQLIKKKEFVKAVNLIRGEPFLRSADGFALPPRSAARSKIDSAVTRRLKRFLMRKCVWLNRESYCRRKNSQPGAKKWL
jgi:NAD-dependent dihydropyrimidine dehydrogenase PreA subunit